MVGPHWLEALIIQNADSVGSTVYYPVLLDFCVLFLLPDVYK